MNDLIERVRRLSSSLDMLACEDVLQVADALEAVTTLRNCACLIGKSVDSTDLCLYHGWIAKRIGEDFLSIPPECDDESCAGCPICLPHE